jgi:hypothetical protein
MTFKFIRQNSQVAKIKFAERILEKIDVLYSDISYLDPEDEVDQIRREEKSA